MLEYIRNKKAFICDMDGVIYHGKRLLDGAAEFVNWLKSEDKQYLFLTNSSERSPKQLSQKLAGMGVESEIQTVLVLSGITSRQEVENFPYRPSLILDGVGHIPK